MDQLSKTMSPSAKERRLGWLSEVEHLCSSICKAVGIIPSAGVGVGVGVGVGMTPLGAQLRPTETRQVFSETSGLKGV